MSKKFALIAGEIMSKTDSDIHWISARRLCELYGLNPDECYFVDSPEQRLGLPSNIQYLGPRYDGVYKL